MKRESKNRNNLYTSGKEGMKEGREGGRKGEEEAEEEGQGGTGKVFLPKFHLKCKRGDYLHCVLRLGR